MPVVINEAMRKRLDPNFNGNATEAIDHTPKTDKIEVAEDALKAAEGLKGGPKVVQVPLHPHLGPIRRGPVVSSTNWEKREHE